MNARRQRRSRAPMRDLHGIVLLDKPSGMTSNAALQVVKRETRARKAGHTGSLDPLASGLLPICLGQATKVCAFLLDAGKRYRVEASVGSQTDTADAQGEVIATSEVACPGEAELEQRLARFRGEIQQVPPMYSALKHKGKRLYDLAREGVEVERKARPVTIYELRLIERSDTGFSLEVACSKGTYIRTLVEDVAASFGGLAHVTALRRTALGPFDLDGAVGLEPLREQLAQDATATLGRVVLPIDRAIADWPAVTLSRECAFYLRNGQPVRAGAAPAAGWVRLYEQDGHFLGVGEVVPDGRVAPRRLFQLPRAGAEN